LLCPVVFPRINNADVTAREILDSAFRQNFDDIVLKIFIINEWLVWGLCERNAAVGNPVDGVKRPVANGNEGSTPAISPCSRVYDGKVDWSGGPGFHADDDVERYGLRDGDFVFARSGSIEKASRSAHD
jgi:hypothetical protein